jgi:acyl carrier protein
MSPDSLGTLDGFLRLVRDDLGLVTDLAGPEAAGCDLTDLPGWDSVNLLRLVTLLEQESGRAMPVGRILEARTLEEIYALVEDLR